MGIKDWFAAFRGSNRLAEIVDQVAAPCLDSVWPQIESNVRDMPLPELRGYVRARTRGSVQRRLAQHDSARQIPIERLVSKVLDEISRLAVARALQAPQPQLIPMPAPVAPIRRAA